ncbi:type II toxin-antitoxin system HicA family toxin [Paludisphaera sp.]|uniref:type II toxin-antitoxin system HicA family toxin n=1 Tax=Paludisphaera sp. TaxID=2017432 RepID=UPI00301DC49C
MGGVSRTLDRILRGTSDASIRFDELRAVLLHLGFDERVRGSHHIFTRSDIPEILNLQPRGSAAKPYQVKQVRAMIDARGLLRDRDESR